MKAMKKEYDFINAVKAKFYRPEEKLEIPVYLDKKVKEFYSSIAKSKETTLGKIVNIILKKEMKIQGDAHKR